jgi:hypothetical protein
VYLLDGCGEAAGLLDGEHERFDLIERAGHPRSQERRQKADRPPRQRTPEPRHTDPFWRDTPVCPELAEAASTLRMEWTFAENCLFPRAIGYIPIGGVETFPECLHVATEPTRGPDAWAHPFQACMLFQVGVSR